MNFRSIVAVSALTLTTISVPASVLAHTKVVASIPAQGATVSSVRNISMTFSEALLGPTVGVSIVMTAMPGMPDHGEMQIRNFTQFFWVSGGLFAEMNIHQIDEICWLKDAWPATAHGIGGRMANKLRPNEMFVIVPARWANNLVPILTAAPDVKGLYEATRTAFHSA